MTATQNIQSANDRRSGHSLQRVVGPKDVKYIKNCACCGKYLKRHRWMLVGGYDYNQNKRPICWDCDASYE